jgi:hypothetical protein
VQHYSVDKDGVDFKKTKRDLKKCSDLLYEHGSHIKSIKFHNLLLQYNLLEYKTRKSKYKGFIDYVVLSKTGLKYGENIDDKNKLNAEPFYYVDKFDELLKLIS